MDINFDWWQVKNFNKEEFIEWWKNFKDEFKSSKHSVYCLSSFCLKYFDIWFNSDNFDWYYSYILCENCSEYFDIWWRPDKFDWNDLRALKVHCQKYKHVWEKDYLIWKLLKQTEQTKTVS